MGGLGCPDIAGAVGREGGQGLQEGAVVITKRIRYFLCPGFLQHRFAERQVFRLQGTDGKVVP